MNPPAEIKARLPIEELVGQYCQIQKKGRNFVSLCPFHNDSHPSLLISPDKGIAYCFACQSGGDIFTFYQAIEGVEFREALKELAEKAGVQLPKDRGFAAGPKKNEKERMRECLQEAVNFYQASLKENMRAVQYLKDRRITGELIASFGIGYAPNSFDLTYTHLLKQGFSRSEILQCGLGVQKELKEERIYDRFRNRIMFPIRDHQGNMIGFGGRTIGDDDAKYINSPDGPLYNKSIALFGLSYAKDAIRKSKSVILVEGYFDVLAFHRIGVENVVSVSGTALTEQHVLILKRIAEKILLCLDKDAAGEEATRRAFILCKKQDLDVATLNLPAGKDPDECEAMEPQKMKFACDEGGIPYLEAMLSSLPERKLEIRGALQLFMPLLNAIDSSVEREEAVKKTAETLGTTETALLDDLAREKQTEERRVHEKTRAVSARFTSVDLLLGLLLAYPDSMPEITRMIEPKEKKAMELHNALTAFVKAESTGSFMETLDGDTREYANVLHLYCEEQFGTWSESLSKKEIKKLMAKVNRELLLTKQKELVEHIREARTKGKKGEEEQLLTQYQQVLKLSAMVK
jgi:DNA primase